MSYSRKIAAVAVLAIFVIGIVAPFAFAQYPCQGSKPVDVVAQKDCGKGAKKCLVGSDAWKKLGRGICNLVTFPFEITNQIGRVNNSDGPMAAFTWGIVKGIGMTGFRALVGAYEVVTFPFPIPSNYDPILTDPEFFFDGELCLY